MGSSLTPPAENRNFKNMFAQASAPPAPLQRMTNTFSGSGLNDATASGTYTGTTIATITITIASAGTPDTFDWTETGGSGSSGSGVSITGSAQSLVDGISVTFGATTGHTATNSWTIVVTPAANMYWASDGKLKAKWPDGTIVVMSGVGGAIPTVDLTAPGPIGSVTPGTGAFTTLTASSGTGVRFGSANGDYIKIGPADVSGTRLLNAGDGSGALDVRDGNGAVGRIIAGTFSATDSNGAPLITVNGSQGSITAETSNSAALAVKSISESITLNTGAATTDSSTNLLPANSIILAVVARVTTSITTSANWKLGDATTADRFTAANSTLTAGTTDYGFRHFQGGVSTDATGPVQISAAKLRITLNAAPGAGVVRVTTFYFSLTAPAN